MGIGNESVKQAQDTDFRAAIAAGLDEALTALEEAVYDLSDEQIAAFPLPDRHNIVTIVMHLFQNLDTYACSFQIGEFALEHDWERFDLWAIGEQGRPRPSGDFPTTSDVIDRLHTLRDAATAALEQATDEDLRGPRHADQHWLDAGKNAADAYMRTILHTMAHVRQIWFLRGVMGLTDKDGWPEQHWA